MKKSIWTKAVILAVVFSMLISGTVWAAEDQTTQKMTGKEEIQTEENAEQNTESAPEVPDIKEPQDMVDSEETEEKQETPDSEETEKPGETPDDGKEDMADVQDSEVLPEAEQEGPQLYVSRAKLEPGWKEKDGRLWYLNEDGTYPASEWQKIGNYTFRFDQNGYLMTGWQVIDGKTYFLKRTGAAGIKGAMLRGWQNVDKKTYYFKMSGDKMGVMFTGLQSIGEKRYYFTPDGADGVKGSLVAKGWTKISGKGTYYFKMTGEKGIKGVALTGWQSIGGKTYYFKQTQSLTGVMFKGWKSIGGKWYYFKQTGNNPDIGRMFIGWQTIGGKRYFLKRTGTYGVKGVMLTGWQKIDGKEYYFNPSGEYVPGKKRIKVAIDAGHQRKGNSEKEPIGPGASEMKAKVSSGTYGNWSKLNEYELNLIVAKKLQTELKNRGYDVYMIRTTHDVNISNSERAKMAAKAGADILVRIHANGDSSSSTDGALTMAPSGSNRYLTNSNIKASQSLSQKIIDSFCKATGSKNRGVLYADNMSGINWSTIPVTIVEMGFMSNRTDDLNMAKSSFQDKMAEGMANGIDRYFS